MLPFLYPDPAIRDALLADPATAPIPEIQRELFRFAEKFVRGSWDTTPKDLRRLRDAGLSDRNIVQWASLGSTQSWFTMSGDGGGVPLDGEALTGPAVGRTRESYTATREGLLAASSEAVVPRYAAPEDGIAWVDTDESADEYRETAHWAEQRGFDDEAYVDILNTVAIQTSLDRLANVLGVRPDPFPLLPRS